MATSTTSSGGFDGPASANGRKLEWIGVTPRQLAGFLAMVFGMFMAILDIQIVSASLAEIQAGLSASSDEIALGADLLPDRRSDDDPAVGISGAGMLSTRVLFTARRPASRWRARSARQRRTSTR